MRIQLPITWIALLLLVLFSNCEQESVTPRVPAQDTNAPILDITYAAPPISYLPPSGMASRFAENVSYGAHKKNVFDIFTLQTPKPTPLVVFLHSGGFTGGDK
jgi:acetyl esterase/lipase